MYQVDMTASVRETSGKGANRRLRAQGITPAVVYGGGKEALQLQMDTKTLYAQLLEFYRVNTVVNLSIEGQGNKNVLIGEAQVNPVDDTLIHVDFCEVDLEKEREFTVPVVFEGTPAGVDLGGEQENYVDAVVLKGKPLDIPNEITINVAELAIGDSMTVADVTFADNLTVVTPAKKVLVAVVK